MEREIEFYNPVSTVTSFYDFDANHNPTRDSVLYGNSNMYRVVRYGRYTSTQSGYKPRLVTAVQKHSDDVPFVQRTQLAYNTKGLLSKKTENYNLADSLSTEYSYDGFGNLKSARVSGAGVNPVTAHTIYDATGRFPTRQYTVPASEKAAFKYDTWGNVIEERDVTNPADTVSLLTTHSYDGWGSRTLTTLPGGRRVKYQSGWVNNFSNKRYFTLVQGDGIPWVKTWYDAVGRETSVETIGPKGIAINKHYAYHYHNADNPVSRGQLSSSSTSQGYQNVIISEHFTYDSRGRLQTQQYISDPAEPDLSNQPTNSIMGKEITYSYGFNNGKKYQTATINGKPYKKTFDAWGGFYESEDALGNKVSYQYHSSGQPKKITAAGAVFNMTYHATGKQETLEDPNAGTVTYTYDAAGRLKTIKDSRNTLTTIHYDRLGRDSCMVQGSINTTWTYGTTNNYNLHRLVKKQTGNNYISYTYNQYGQPQTESRSIEGVILDFSYLYNNKGQLQQTSYPNSLDITNEYDAYGNLVKILAGTQAVWELTGNTGIMTTAALHGDAMTATAERNMMGYLTSLKTTKANTQIRDMAFVFDPPSGNLTSRTGMMDDKETFRYDHIDRLEEVLYGADAQTLQMKMEYAGNGNIISKTGLGTYTYGNMAGPHAVTGIQDAGQLINPRGQKIEYTVFHKASLLKDTVGNDAYELAITYGPDQQRWKTVLKKNGSVAKTVIFADNYERITRNDTTTHLYYVNGGIYVKQVKGASTILKNEMYYVHPDHLGSLMTITDAAGNIKQKSAFDAWGKRTFVIRDNSLIFDRGYTGHEHLDEFGLINMNGRMYNPIVGRFLSPDPFVQAPDFSQSYNRYSYVLNNPLIYTDPNGEFIFKFLGALLGPVGATIGSVLDAACWGASIGGGIYTVNAALNPGGLSQNWNSNDFWRSAGVGAISGAFGAGAGMLTQGLQIYGAAPGALVKGGIQGLFGGLGGGFGNVLMENDWDAFGKGFTQGFTTGFIMGSISGGIEGYKNAKSVGANKWTGRLYTDETTYSTTLKQGIPLQPNPERDCYGYALEYADSGHGNRNAAYFLGEANNAPGADVGQVFKKADARNFNWSSRISESQWDNVGGHLSRGKEILATTSRDGMNHWVNLTSVTTANKLRVIGGGFRRVLQSTSVWDPIRGHVSNGPASFFSVVSLF